MSDPGPVAAGPGGRETPSRASIVLTLAAGVAMAAALAFVIRVLMIRYIANDFANVSRDYLWMAPVGYLLLFGALALPVLLVSRVLDVRRTTWFACWVFVTVALFDFFMPLTGLGRGAALLLAAGLGAAVARRASRDGRAAQRLAGAAALAIMSGLGAAAGLVRGGPPPTPGPAPSRDAPDVLLLILDTVRADALGVYGNPRGTTPHLDSLATRGVLFESAMATAPWTLPSHGSLVTGRYAASLSADYKVPLDAADSTLAEVLAVRGYTTAGFVGNVWYTSWESGLTRGFQHFEDYARSLEQVIRTTHLGRTDLADELLRSETWRDAARAVRRLGLREVPRPQPARRTAESISDAFLGWHERRDRQRPYFALLNYFDAHEPYLPDEPWRSRFTRPGDQVPSPRDRYDAEVAYLDDQIGRLFTELARRGALSRTLVVVTADHGEHFGERNQLGHFNSIYMALLHVPLLVRFDGRVPAGRRIPGEVSLRDVPATILDLAGAGPPGPIPGSSLARRWASDAGATSPAVSTYAVTKGEPLRELSNGMLSLTEDGWHYILSGRKAHEELYQYRADLREAKNLVGSDSGFARTPAMRARLYAALEADRASSHLPVRR